MKLDKSVIQVVSQGSQAGEDIFRWKSMTPEERLIELEINRRACYGDAATGRLQRIFEVLTRE